MLQHLVDNLMDLRRARPQGWPARFHALLGEVAKLNDPKSISLLLDLLEDDDEFEEVLFSVIHAVESFPDEVYVRELLASLPRLVRRTPRWARILTTRVMNNPNCLQMYLSALQRATDEQREAVKSTLRTVKQLTPKFETQIAEITRFV